MRSNLIFLVFLALLLAGCQTVSRDFTAKTTASYKANGTEILYDSSKDQEGFKAEVEFDSTGKLTKLKVETTATTPEASIAAALQANSEALKTVNGLLQEALKRVPSKTP